MFSKSKSLHSSQATGKTRSGQTMLGTRNIIIIVLISMMVSACASPSAPQVTEIQTYENLTQAHTTEAVSYPQSPPVGGPHDPAWQNCGFYDQPVRNENAVHSLEHGAVWITYQPDLPGEEIGTLQEMAPSRSHLLVSPYPELPAPVVASAWGVQLALESADDERLLEFITEYMQGPQTPEPGAPCAGGIGTPL